MDGEKSTINLKMSIEAAFVTLFSEAKVISIACRTPKLFRVLKNDSRAWGCKVVEKEKNSFKNRTSSLRRFSSVSSSVNWLKSSVRNFSSSWSWVTISFLLKKMNDDSVDNMFSSKTEGVGNTTSCMYWTRYVWCILDSKSGLLILITSWNEAIFFRYSRCLLGEVKFGSNSRQPTTSKIVSSANI